MPNQSSQLEILHESDNFITYSQYSDLLNKKIVIKTFKDEYSDIRHINRLNNEYQFCKNIKLDGIRNVYRKTKFNGQLALYMEYIDGESIQSYIAKQKPDLKNILKAAIKIAGIIGDLHQKNIVHKGISSSHILIHPKTKDVTVINFGISSRLDLKMEFLGKTDILEGSLPYISPEQTGRMNRVVDYRSDFYSFGVTLYEMLTGQLPFNSHDPLKLVHCHIAKTPRPPHTIVSSIPEGLSDVILKLLAKNAEDRYQSAYGLQSDLEYCLENLQDLSKFQVGQSDFSARLQIPQKLYAREQEIEKLSQAIKRSNSGTLEMMLVTGFSGVGKSSLVNESYKITAEKSGYFISGKFDQFQRNSPYSAFNQAFSQLCQSLLMETEDVLEQWRNKILKAVGANGAVLIDMIPEFELIIGPQPPVPDLSYQESQNRFIYLFRNFLQVISQVEHPLVIFIDDLQWIDSASLKLLKVLMTDFDNRYLLLIGAFRDNEVDPGHPLIITLQELEEANVTINALHLNDISLSDVNTLIAETLSVSSRQVGELSELVYRKTQGNPYFTDEFLKSLYRKGLLTFSNTEKHWTWDIESIRAMEMSRNVTDLMITRIESYPMQTQQVLFLAACISIQFDIRTLATICRKTVPQTYRLLWPAIEERIIEPLDRNYKHLESNPKLNAMFRFSHDRVQQAAYSFIPDVKKTETHLTVGRLLLQNTIESELDEHIFDIVNHFNRSIDRITDEKERLSLSNLNLKAGRKAVSSAAYQAAYRYFDTGVRFLPERCWEKHYKLTLDLNGELAEAAFMINGFEKAEDIVETILRKSTSTLDTVKVHTVKTQIYMARNQQFEAIQSILELLDNLGIHLPEKPEQADILDGIQDVNLILAEREIETLIDLPEMTSPFHLAGMHILKNIFAPAFAVCPELFVLSILKQVYLSIKYGNAPLSSLAYAGYGMLLCGPFEDIENGYRYGKLALNLVERCEEKFQCNRQNVLMLEARKFKARTIQTVNTFIRHWKEPGRETLKPFLESYQYGMENGDIEYATYAAIVYGYYSIVLGKNLKILEEEMSFYSALMRRYNQEISLYLNEQFRQTVLNLRGKSKNPCCLSGEAFDEDKMLPLYLETNNVNALFILHYNKMRLCYVFQNYRDALENSKLAKKYLIGATATPLVSSFYFFDSLVSLAAYPEAEPTKQNDILDHVLANRDKLKTWSEYAPANQLSRLCLVDAELARITGKKGEAREFFDKAIKYAREEEYFNEEALSNELAGKFYLENRHNQLAQLYLNNAYQAYQVWGADGKLRDMEMRYPQWLSQKRFHSGSLSVSEVASFHGDTLDLSAILKASQAISSEIEFGSLLKIMMRVVIDNAGAEKGFFIEVNQGEMIVRDSNNNGECLEKSEKVPKNVIHYVFRSQRKLVMDNASADETISTDTYFQQNKVRSLCCFPIIRQHEVKGLLYLENNLTEGAFTQSRLETLRILSSQLAISLENAMLYNNLDQRVQQRTQELKKKNQIISQKNEESRELLHILCHDLSNPMSSVLGAVELIEEYPKALPDMMDMIKGTMKNGMDIIALVRKMRALDEKKLFLKLEKSNLLEMINESVAIIRHKIQEKGVELEIHVNMDVEVKVEKTSFVNSVLNNLLTNAIKFSLKGEIITIRSSWLSNQKMVLSIKDSGIGMPAQLLRDLFSISKATSRAGTDGELGTGFGMPLVKKFISIYDGKIEVFSKEKIAGFMGHGTEVRLTLNT